jgi:hypothetical protein
MIKITVDQIYHRDYQILLKTPLKLVIKSLKSFLTKKVDIIGLNLGVQKFLFVFIVILIVNISKPMPI